MKSSTNVKYWVSREGREFIYLLRFRTKCPNARSRSYLPYKTNGITWKKIIYTKRPATENIDQKLSAIQNVNLSIVGAKSEGRRILYVDESTFTYQTLQEKAFSNRY